MTCGSSVYPVQTHDLEGRWLRWPARSYNLHRTKRPEIEGWHSQIAQAVANPDLVVERPSGGWNYYGRGLLSGKYAGCYLLVGVRWVTDVVGDITTAFATFELQPYERIVRWPKK